jgi:hypothetical protein
MQILRGERHHYTFRLQIYMLVRIASRNVLFGQRLQLNRPNQILSYFIAGCRTLSIVHHITCFRLHDCSHVQ